MSSWLLTMAMTMTINDIYLNDIYRGNATKLLETQSPNIRQARIKSNCELGGTFTSLRLYLTHKVARRHQTLFLVGPNAYSL